MVVRYGRPIVRARGSDVRGSAAPPRFDGRRPQARITGDTLNRPIRLRRASGSIGSPPPGDSTATAGWHYLPSWPSNPAECLAGSLPTVGSRVDQPGGLVFHHHSMPDVSQLPTGAYLVRRKLGSIEGYLVYDDFDTQVYRFKGHLAFPGQRWSMVDGAGRTWPSMVRPPLHVHPMFTLSRPGRADVRHTKVELLADSRVLASRRGRRSATSTSRATFSIMNSPSRRTDRPWEQRPGGGSPSLTPTQSQVDRNGSRARRLPPRSGSTSSNRSRIAEPTQPLQSQSWRHPDGVTHVDFSAETSC